MKSSIQYGKRNCGTHALELFLTLAHGNSKNDTRQGRRQEKMKKYEKQVRQPRNIQVRKAKLMNDSVLLTSGWYTFKQCINSLYT